MLQFCYYMTVNSDARKVFCYNLLFAAIIFHIVFYNTHDGDWGIMVSTVPMLMMFSVKWLEWFLQRLSDYRKELWGFTILTLMAICAPHLLSLGVTFAIIIFGVSFYPPKIIRGIDPYLVSAEYSRAIMTRNYDRFIGCYFE